MDKQGRKSLLLMSFAGMVCLIYARKTNFRDGNL